MKAPLLRAYNDPVIFRDDRVFRTLLQKQSKYVPSSHSYYTAADGSGQIQPEMRKEVADWMLEVCEHQSLQFQHPTCPPEVFCLAMNYVDRFLSACSNIARSQLQLLGAVCLMVAWKVREHEPLSAKKLVEYSDFTLTLDDIVEWEVLLLSKLEWDMSAVIAFDFVEHIIQRLENSELVRQSEGLSMNALRSSSETLITMCSGHHDFSNLSPCLIAAACVVSTLKSMLTAAATDTSSSSDLSMTSVASSSFTAQQSSPDLDRIFQVIREITSLNKDQIEKCMEDVDAMVKSQHHQKSKSSPNRSQDLVFSPPSAAVTSTPRRQGLRAPPPPETDPQTPTKVMDVISKTDC